MKDEDKNLIILDRNKTERDYQDEFLELYREAQGADKTIKKTCQKMGIHRSTFDTWLADPEFEDRFWSLRRAFSYELEERLSTISDELMKHDAEISKNRFMALQIAHKSVLEIIGKLNRERFGESTEVRLKQEGNIQPSINISLVSADITNLIDQKIGASIAPILVKLPE